MFVCFDLVIQCLGFVKFFVLRRVNQYIKARGHPCTLNTIETTGRYIKYLSFRNGFQKVYPSPLFEVLRREATASLCS
jgi:hypothetical protein